MSFSAAYPYPYPLGLFFYTERDERMDVSKNLSFVLACFVMCVSGVVVTFCVCTLVFRPETECSSAGNRKECNLLRSCAFGCSSESFKQVQCSCQDAQGTTFGIFVLLGTSTSLLLAATVMVSLLRCKSTNDHWNCCTQCDKRLEVWKHVIT